MYDTVIHGAVLRRIEEAADAGDVALLRRHLSSNYDDTVHRAVYEALGTIGDREAIAVLLDAAPAEKNEELKRVLFQAITGAMTAHTAESDRICTHNR